MNEFGLKPMVFVPRVSNKTFILESNNEEIQ